MEEERSLMEHLKPTSKEEMESMRLTSQDDRDTRSLLAGATPLLVGLLAGNVGDGAEIAGRALIDEDQRQLKEDSDLLGYIRKRELKKSSGLDMKPQKVTFYNEKGVGRGGYFRGGKYYETSGEEVPSPTLYNPITEEAKTIARNRGRLQSDPAFGVTIREDDQGQLSFIDYANKTAKPVSPSGSLTPVQEKKVDSANKEYSKFAAPLEESVMSSRKALDLLSMSNNTSDRAAITMFAKQLEPGGRLSDFDVRRLEGGQGALDFFMKMFTKVSNGEKLTDKQRGAVSSTIKRINDLTREDLKIQRDRFIRRAGKSYDMKNIGKYLPTSLDQKSSTINVTNGKETYEIDMSDLEDAINDGFEVAE